MTKTDNMKKSILDRIYQLDIAGYLKEELEKLLWYFHYYKMNNIYKNIEFLEDYLMFLDYKSTKNIHQLDHQYKDFDMEWEHDVFYYISKKWLDIVWEKKIKQKIYQNDYNLHSNMQGIKWFLLLTMDEFCNATPVRLSIDQTLWHKEKNLKNEKNESVME